MIYTLTHLGVLWNEAKLIVQAEEIVNMLPVQIDQERQLDIIGGAAGCILSLLSLYRISQSQKTLDSAIRCGDLLLARASRQEIGSAWDNTNFGRRALTGFSHGTAGIAYALTELGGQTGQEHYYAMSLEAMAYERSLFNSKLGNLPDLRELEVSVIASKLEARRFPWHGVMVRREIGLGRLNMLWHFDDPAIRAEIEAAVKTTFALGLGDNQSLCHGALGNLEFLLQAAETLSRPTS